MQEAGISNYVVEGWYGVAGPAGLPASVVDKLNREIDKMLNQPDMRAAMAADGAFPVGGTAKAFAAHISSEVQKWSRIVKEAAIKTD
jgi:tripartite-type tricarboxylate transporter receptor subunit TctC